MAKRQASNSFLEEMGSRITAQRKKLGLTQGQLAERTHTTVQTISTAERGIKALRPENLVKISDALNVSTDYILKGEMYIDNDEISEALKKLPHDKRQIINNVVLNCLALISNDDSK